MLEEKRNYLIAVKSNSMYYPDVKYYGTLRGAKVACSKYYGPAIYRGEHLLIKTYDDDEDNDYYVCEKHEDGWRDW